MIFSLLIFFSLDDSSSNLDPLPFPYLSAPPLSDLGSGAETDDDIFSDCGSDDLNDPFENDSKDDYVEPDPQVKGIIQTYLASVKYQ